MIDDFDESEMFSQPAARPAPTNTNPLAKYFRVPGVHITIPTKGAYMPPGTIEFTATGELPVFPMRAADEMLLKSPDALMSGYAIEELIRSCVPSIRAPEYVSLPDLDVLMLAIRAATSGNDMDVEASCPSCGHQNSFTCNIPAVLSTMKEIPGGKHIRLDAEAVVYLRPHDIRTGAKIAMAAFQETRRAQYAEQLDEDERQKVLHQSYRKLADLNTEVLADSIVSIVLPDVTVTDKRMIREFLDKVSASWSKAIQKGVQELNEGGINRSLEAVCQKCNHTWDVQLEFNPSSFFGQGS
jgi:hypothetical protein